MHSLFTDACCKEISGKPTEVAVTNGYDLKSGQKGTPGYFDEVTLVNVPGGIAPDAKAPMVPLGSTVSGFPK